jgi:hypothetical protein
MVTEVVVSSLGELIDRVTPEQPDAVTGRRRDSGIYRGSASAQWPLLTSLDRLGGVHPPHTKAYLEEHLLRNFIRYSRPHIGSQPANDWELLVLAQHHGLPTRLLDWTYSPFVAAHFTTTAEGPTGDRAVWRLDWQKVHRAFHLPELALLIQDVLNLFSQQFTPWKLFNWPKDGKAFACMLEPPSLDLRIVTQSAVFTLCTDKTHPFDKFLEEHGLGDALTKFIIPGSELGRLRDQLDMVGFDERRIYPDLDGLTAQMRRYYS